MADVNLGQLASTTLRNRSSEIANSVLNNNALLAYLKKQGKIKTRSGGRTFVEPIYFAENGSAKWYAGGMDSLTVH